MMMLFVRILTFKLTVVTFFPNLIIQFLPFHFYYMFYILDLSFLLLSAIEFLRNSAIQVKFIIIIIINSVQ